MRAALLIALALVASAAAKRCSEPDLTCLGRKQDSYCYQGQVYACANADYRCQRGAGCPATKPQPLLVGRQSQYRDFQCTDNTHFAWGGFSMLCAPGTWCRDDLAARGTNPCLPRKPAGSCTRYGGDMACVDARSFCQRGMRYTCPFGFVCAGKGPCVKAA